MKTNIAILSLILWFTFFSLFHLNAQPAAKPTKLKSTTSVKISTPTKTIPTPQIPKPTSNQIETKKYKTSSNPRSNISPTQESKETVKMAPVAYNENVTIQKAKVLTPVTYSTKALNKTDLYLHFWENYYVRNNRAAKRQNRHCGCAGDIEYINKTSDTLDFYFKYLSVLETPALDDAVLPPIAINNSFASFSIAPGDSASFRGYCRGGLQYELTTRKNRFTGQGHDRKDVHINSFVRLSCMSKTLIISEDME
jgi:hypothetical protein